MNQVPLQPLEAVAVDPTVSASAMQSNGSTIFGFESDLERSLTCIPLAVRFKLDKCGIKLSLDQWQSLPEGKRQDLLKARCEGGVEIANFRHALQALIRAASGDEPRLLEVGKYLPWDAPEVPAQVKRKVVEAGGPPPTASQWRDLTPLERFALVKLSRDGEHGRNLIPALREFGLPCVGHAL